MKFLKRDASVFAEELLPGSNSQSQQKQRAGAGLIIFALWLLCNGSAHAGLSSRSQEAVLELALSCANAQRSNPCEVKSCFEIYVAETPPEDFASSARQTLSSAEIACRALDSGQSSRIDGSYNARSDRGCGVGPQFGIRLVIKGRDIFWEHQLQGISYRWTGKIDQAGTIRASVGNSKELVADGKYDESSRNIMMQYPQCKNGPISLSIMGKL